MRLALALLLTVPMACADDEPAKTPTCAEIGAPDTLTCNRGGLCDWDGQPCCVAPVRGSEPDPACIAL